jgi:hypothetical protein
MNIFSTKDDFLRLSDLEKDTEDVVELFNFFFRGEQKSGDLKVPLCCLGLKFELKSSSSLDMTIGIFLLNCQ